MKKKYQMVSLLISCAIYSQNSLGDNETFKNLPEIYQEKIFRKIPELAKQDTLFVEARMEEGDIRYIWKTKIFVEDGQLFGESERYEYKKSREKMNYPGKSNLKIVFLGEFTSSIMYCCKDERHMPSEMAKKKEEMLLIQKKNNCKKIGVCLF
jgi:hypothetical protein